MTKDQSNILKFTPKTSEAWVQRDADARKHKVVRAVQYGNQVTMAMDPRFADRIRQAQATEHARSAGSQVVQSSVEVAPAITETPVATAQTMPSNVIDASARFAARHIAAPAEADDLEQIRATIDTYHEESRNAA